MAAVRTVRTQVHAVQRRANLRALQHAAFLGVALLAALAALLIPLALLAGPAPFALGLGAAAVAALAGCGILVRRARRRWLSASGTARWIDRTVGLADRIESVLTVRPAAGPLLPVLRAQAAASMRRWTPRRMVPRPIAAGPLAAAGAAVATLLLAFAVAPRLQPAVPDVVAERSVDGAGMALPGVRPARVVPARGGGGSTEGRTEPGTDGATAAGGEGVRFSAVERLAASLQSRLRDRLLGEGWRRRAAAAAPGAGSDRAGARPPASPGGTGAATTWTQARASVDADRRAPSSPPDAEPGTWVDAARDPAAGRAETDTPPAASGGAGSPGRGAGSGTDPALYGRPSETVHAAADPFALGITARVRAAGVGPRPPVGDAPAADADARPGLGGAQRRELPVRRLDVPADLEPLVQALFAHRQEVR